MRIEIGAVLERFGELREPCRVVPLMAESLAKFGNDMKRKIRKNGYSHCAL